MAKGSAFASIRFWLAERQNGIGFALAALVLVLLTVIALPVGSPTQLVGRVTGFGFKDTVKDNYHVAHVQLPDRQVALRLAREEACGIGDRIHVREERAIWGTTYKVGFAPCDFQSEGRHAQAR